ncbi:MAG: MerR family transcriptional regulator [Geminicoccaceae bacterium]
MIGRLSERVGLNIETIRYYERVGLLPAPPRSGGGHRLYDARHVMRLTFIRRSRELGFSLDQVRHLLELVDGGHTCGEVKAVAIDHVAHIREKIADLRRLERTLVKTAARCEGRHLPNRCPGRQARIIAPRSASSRSGGGRRPSAVQGV